MTNLKPSGGPDHTFTREELLRVRNAIVKKVTKPKQETSKRNRKRK